MWCEGPPAHPPTLTHSPQTAAPLCVQQAAASSFGSRGFEKWPLQVLKEGNLRRKHWSPGTRLWSEQGCHVCPWSFCFLESMQLRESEAWPSNTQVADRYCQCACILFSISPFIFGVSGCLWLYINHTTDFLFHWEHLPLFCLSMKSWSNATSSLKSWKLSEFIFALNSFVLSFGHSS